MPFVLLVVLGGVFMRAVHRHAVTRVQTSAWAPAPPQVQPDSPTAPADRPTFPSAGPGEGQPPFSVELGPSLQRFEIARLGWRAQAAAWGTPAVLWADLRPVRANGDRRMPGILLAWCDGPAGTQMKRATAEWGTDTSGPVLHVLIDFNGLEHPVTGLRLGAD